MEKAVQQEPIYEPSLGNLTQQEIEKLKKISLPKTGKPYIVLAYAKINKNKYITYQQAAAISPERFFNNNKTLTPKRVKETLSSLYRHQFIEQNPNNSEEFRITQLGLKFLYCKRFLKKGSH
jgi:hypothetical protein